MPTKGSKGSMQSQLERLLPDPKRVSESFTRENVIASLKTMGWVVPLTILIWIYAEREQIDTQPERIIPIDVRTTAPNRIVTLISPVDKNIISKMTGPRAQLDRLVTLLRPGESENVPVMIDIDPSLPPGRHSIASARIGDNPMFTGRGITVSDCRPPLLTVEVDALVARSVPIQVPATKTNIDGAPVFSPTATASVRGPQSLLDRLNAEGKLVVYANLSDRPDLQAPGTHELKDVPLVMPAIQLGESHVTISPTSVSATVKVKQVEDRLVYRTMTIFVTTPYNFSDRYRVKLIGDPFVHDITLLGPAEVLSAMQKEDFHPKPLARLTVTSDDLPPGTTRTRELKFELPEGVRVSPEDSHHSVQFTIEDAAKE
jgi:hypothetical protein